MPSFGFYAYITRVKALFLPFVQKIHQHGVHDVHAVASGKCAVDISARPLSTARMGAAYTACMGMPCMASKAPSDTLDHAQP